MIRHELKQLEKITNALTTNGYLVDNTKEWEYAFNAMSDAIFVINRAHVIRFANTKLLSLLGLTKKDVLGKYCHDVLRSVSSPEECGCDFQKDLTEKCHFGEYRIENLDRWFDFTRSPIFSESGKLLGFICVLRDTKINKHNF
jgi:PAS domain S-box-containing protein